MPVLKSAMLLVLFWIVLCPVAHSYQEQTTESHEIKLVVSDESGRPIGGSTVEVIVYAQDSVSKILKTKADGTVKFLLDQAKQKVNIIISKPGYVSYSIQGGATASGFFIPELKEISLERGREVTGFVKNESGAPIADAKVVINAFAQECQWGERVSTFIAGMTKTGPDGRWTYNGAPFDIKAFGMNVTVYHDDYLDAYSSQPNVADGSTEFESVMAKGISIDGYVFDEAGNPLNDAQVCLGSPLTVDAIKVQTDMAGQFFINKCREGETFIVVTAKGYAPELMKLNIDRRMERDDESLEVKLGKGTEYRGQIVDIEGKPISGATLYVTDWREPHSIDVRIQTNRDGEFVWKNAPTDHLHFGLIKKGFLRLEGFHLEPSVDDQVIKLRKAPQVSIKVVDSETDELIDDLYAMIGKPLSEGDNEYYWGVARSFESGKIDWHYDGTDEKFAMRIGGNGYQSIVREFKCDVESTELTIELKKFASWREQAWEPIRVKIESGQLPMQVSEVPLNLYKLGATIELDNANNIWTVRLQDKFGIPGATHGVPTFAEDEAKKTWHGSLQDLDSLNELSQVKLNLKGFNIDADLLEALAEVKSLTHLDLDDCPLQVNDTDIELLKNLVELRAIYLDGHWQEFPETGIEALSTLQHLDTLVFDGCGCYKMTSDTFENHLENFQSLRTLELTSDQGFENSIGDVIAKTNQLERLGIQGKEIDDAFLDKIKSLDLRGLDVSGTSISDRGLKIIAGSFPNIEHLDLRRTKITADGIRYLVSRCKKLNRLDLDEIERDVLVDFHRNHPFCVIYRQITIRNGVVVAERFELTDEEKN